jgi:uncharacterized protein YaaQ
VDLRVPDRLVVAIVQVDDAPALADALTADGFGATRIDAAGGFLRRTSAVLLVATAEERLPALYRHVRATCRERVVPWVPPLPDPIVGSALPPVVDVPVGGAVVLVLPIAAVAYLGLPERLARAVDPIDEGVDHEAAAIGA